MTRIKSVSKLFWSFQICVISCLSIHLSAQSASPGAPSVIAVAGITVGKTTVSAARKLWIGLKIESPFQDDDRLSARIGGCVLSVQVEGKANDNSIISLVDISRAPNETGGCLDLKIGKHLNISSDEKDLKKQHPYLLRSLGSYGIISYSFVNSSDCRPNGLGILYSVDARISKNAQGLEFFAVEKSKSSCRDYRSSEQDWLR